MKTLIPSLLLTLLVMILPGCAIFDALDTYHYIGIYEVDYTKQNIAPQERTAKFDHFCQALKGTTGLEVRVIMRDGYTKMACVVFPPERKTGLNRVVISEEGGQELSISIVKVAAGEDVETTKMKQNIESAFRAVEIPKWIFYVQRSHGQIFNS